MNRLACVAVLASAAFAQGAALGDDWPQWRGPDRTGVSKETGLLKEWPDGGPRQLWAVKTPGASYSAVSVVGDTIYSTATEGKVGVLYALDPSGTVKWRQTYGREFTANNPCARTTPTIRDGCAYVFSGEGDAACIDAGTGKKVWAVETFARFKGRNIEWGIAESPLIVGELFICHPGGPDAAVVALNRKTGQTVWTSKGLGERSAYCSPLAVQVGGKTQIVTQTEDHVVGLDAATGQVLWKVPQRNRYAVHPNTPVFFDGMVYITCGYGYGSQLLKLAADGTAAQVWSEKMADNHFQGAILVDGRLYVSSQSSKARGKLLCLDPKDGRVLYTVSEATRPAIIYADGRLYGYCDTSAGEVFLLEVGAEGYKVRGRFNVKQGSGPHWAHPVVANGVLYIRHGEVLMAYDVKAK